MIGEHSGVALLGRPGHRELRSSGLRRVEAAESSGPHITLAPLTVREYHRLPRGGQVDRGIVRPFDPPAATPTGWLAIHPRLADSVGLRHAGVNSLDWTLNDRPAVRSLWWRSGYLRWDPYSENDEVGEGWLVLGAPELVERLHADGWELAYEVGTSRQGDEDLAEQEIRVRGTRALRPCETERLQ